MVEIDFSIQIEVRAISKWVTNSKQVSKLIVFIQNSSALGHTLLKDHLSLMCALPTSCLASLDVSLNSH